MPTKEWLEKNKKRIKEYKKQWRENNREKCVQYNNNYYNKPENAQRRRDKAKEWLLKNRDAKLAYLRKLKHTAGECKLCKFNLPEALDVHHIIPKSRGGNNSIENLVTLCANCHRLVHAGKIDLKTMEKQSD